MVEALIDAGKPYDLLLYPGKTHGIFGTTARVHLFGAIERYLDEHLR
jgi:dipeptidyl-peptidase-4